MHRQNRTATLNVYQFFLDTFCIIIAYFLSILIYQGIKYENLLFEHLWLLIILLTVTLLSMFLLRMYDITMFNYADRIILRTFISVFIAGCCISTTIFLLQLDTTSRLIFAFSSLLSFLLISIQRLIVRAMRKAGMIRARTRVLFVGDKKIFEEYQRFANKTSLMIRFVDPLRFSDKEMKSSRSLAHYIIENQIDEIVMVYDDRLNVNYEEYLLICEEMGITVRFALTMMKLSTSYKYVSSVGTIPVLTYHSVSMARLQLFIKYTTDFLFSLIGVILLSPLFLLVALAIKLESKGPVFFKQKRAGLNGKVFTIYKFRSMHVDAEERKKELHSQNKIKDGMMFKIDNDPRSTKVGKLIRKMSIDELPQLFNILRGDMSVVGTRPPTLDEIAKYEIKHRRRISIKPGLTGMWQVNGRSNILDFNKVVELDEYYINNWSLLLDFKLVCKTFIVVLFGRGAK